MHKGQFTLTLAAAMAITLSCSAMGATIFNPAIVSSPGTAATDLINPGGFAITAASGSTSEAAIEAISNLNVIQAWPSELTGGTNVFAFTDASMPDIQISFGGNVAANTGIRLANSSFLTSAPDSMRIQGSREGSFSMTIDFGTWDGAAFCGAGNAVEAAAFTLFGLDNEFSSFQAVFYDEAGAVLNTQSTGADAYFGFQSSGSPISSIEVAFNTIGVNDGPLGFDDLAFTPVPEPASVTLLLTGAALAAARRRQGVKR